ncbi:MFS transporter [Carbonactinospora thermoautotrophica]|uniref:MFS transporter n=1 Tax=Carbonactinospora thermoautotrophica TaxID=1469144 RepID=UPI00099EEAFA|nr:MFS transporter [Carbonactinospora thermoautotrophica]
MTELLNRPVPTVSTPSGRRRGRWIEVWDPENEAFWATTGRRVARRNLIFSIFAEHLGFTTWLLWSAVVVFLPQAGFTFSVSQLFWLLAVPNLVGSFLRLPYTFAVPKFGGRNWTVVSALLLLIPTGLLVVAVSDPDTPYWFFLLAAATAGVGGGNFASSMANISFFYPEKEKGFALGLNAAGGNIGTAVVQLVVPVVVTLGSGVTVAYAGLAWMPFIVLAAVGAWLFMDNLAMARSDFKTQAAAAKRSHTWVMSFLYIGTFGSFIGYSAAMPLLLKTQFPGTNAVSYAFAGALIGSVARPFGGWLSDKLGGARVTFATFLVMGAGVLGVMYAVEGAKNLPLFLASFAVLFAATGVGNGSTYRMIPAIFRAWGEREASRPGGPSRAEALAAGRREAAAAIGISSAVGAFGGFLINQQFAASIKATGGVSQALIVFIAFYAICLAVTWFCYLRRRFLVARVPSLADATV